MKNKKDAPPKVEKEDFYMENGFVVFKESYHLKRGYCCGNKCRHCPYNFVNVRHD